MISDFGSLHSDLTDISVDDKSSRVFFNSSLAESASPMNEQLDLDVSHQPISKRRAYLITAILFCINLLNYMDRYTVAAVLLRIQQYFHIDDSMAGLLQTVFICAYMIFAPICGYLGDRYSRKLIMMLGIFVWSCTVLLSSFVGPDYYWLFAVTRAIVGIGEASYSTVSPVIIGDLFGGDQRSMMLMIFYFAIPVGSGLGYIIGGEIASLMNSWQWGVRLTPLFGAVCLLCLLFIYREPQRGLADSLSIQMKAKTLKQDLVYLAKNQSFVFSTLGFVCVSSASGAVALWTPAYLTYSQLIQNRSDKYITLMFGLVTCLAGFVGVSIGSVWASRWRKSNSDADPLVCAIGMIFSLPCFFAAINLSHYNLFIIFPLIFFAIAGLCLNWAVISDILMCVIVPFCRSLANAVQMLIGHLLGDAISPYILGLTSDLIRNGNSSNIAHYYGLKYALYIPAFVLVFGAFFFVCTAWFINEDKMRATEAIKGVYVVDASPASSVSINNVIRISGLKSGEKVESGRVAVSSLPSNAAPKSTNGSTIINNGVNNCDIPLNRVKTRL